MSKNMKNKKPQSKNGTSSKNKPAPSKPKSANVGKVYRGVTKYIDKDEKPQRNFVILKERDKKVTVAKTKSIKQFDEKGKNADKALVEINQKRYGLEERTGVDFQRFDRNRMSGKPLTLSDKKVFPEDKERFTLGSHDLSRTLRHTSNKTKKKNEE